MRTLRSATHAAAAFDLIPIAVLRRVDSMLSVSVALCSGRGWQVSLHISHRRLNSRIRFGHGPLDSSLSLCSLLGRRYRLCRPVLWRRRLVIQSAVGLLFGRACALGSALLLVLVLKLVLPRLCRCLHRRACWRSARRSAA
eukprot:scaffold165909_cov28-Tisochrysis_lutea.AAC.2